MDYGLACKYRSDQVADCLSRGRVYLVVLVFLVVLVVVFFAGFLN